MLEIVTFVDDANAVVGDALADDAVHNHQDKKLPSVDRTHGSTDHCFAVDSHHCCSGDNCFRRTYAVDRAQPCSKLAPLGSHPVEVERGPTDYCPVSNAAIAAYVDSLKSAHTNPIVLCCRYNVISDKKSMKLELVELESKQDGQTGQQCKFERDGPKGTDTVQAPTIIEDEEDSPKLENVAAEFLTKHHCLNHL